LAEKNIRCTLRLESGKAAAVVVDTQTGVGHVGEKKVYMRTVNIAPIAGGLILRREEGAFLFLQAVVVADKVKAVFEAAAMLDEHKVEAVAPDEHGNAVSDDAPGFGQLVEGDGLRWQSNGKQHGCEKGENR